MSGSPRALPCTDPSGLRIRGPTIAQSGCASRTLRRVATAPATSLQSGFMMSTSGAVDAASPWLTPREKPTFAVFCTSCTIGAKLATDAPLPSLEALSTTNASHERPTISSAIDRRARASSPPAL